jgi:hypothetical protein
MRKKLSTIVNSFFLHSNTSLGERFNKFGMSELVKTIVGNAYGKGPLGWSNSTAKDELIKRMEKFFSTFETSLGTIKKNQRFFKRLISDKKLVNFLLTKRYPSFVDSRESDAAYSSSNDAMAIGTVDYIKELTELFGDVPEYASMRKMLNGIRKSNPWIHQMETLSESGAGASSFVLKADIYFYCNSQYDSGLERYYKFDTNSFVMNFTSNGSPASVYNRVKGSIRTNRKKTKRKPEVSRSDVSQEIGSISTRAWEWLIHKIVDTYGWKDLATLEAGNSLDRIESNITIKVSTTGKISAVVAFGNNSPRKLSFVCLYPKKDDDYDTEDRWVFEGEKYRPVPSRKEKISRDSFEYLRTIKRSYVFTSSRRFVFSYLSDFKAIFSKMDELIMLAAIVNYYHENEGRWVFPTMTSPSSFTTKISAGINPLLLPKTKGNVVPNDAVFSKKKNSFLITGANTGGKTAYTNMIALTQMLAQTGLPVFAKSATLSIKDKVLCHYVESEDIGVNLSRYQSELHRLGKVIEDVTPHSLVLFDEPFSGTGVESGTEQAHQVLRVMSRVGCAFVMNTHFHNLIDMVGNNGTSSVTNLHFILPNPESPKPTDYKALPGGIKISYGEAIAAIEKVDYRSMISTLKKRRVTLRPVA